jgi:hypothetical protein
MHLRRLASFLLGIWIGGIVFAILATVETMRSAETYVLAGATGALELAVSADAAGTLMKYGADQRVRTYLERFQWSEVLLGVALAIVLFVGSRSIRLAAAATVIMLLLAVFLQVFMFPEIDYLARRLEFVNPREMASERSHLLALQWTYVEVGAVKLLLGLVTVGYLLIFRAHTRRASPAVAD